MKQPLIRGTFVDFPNDRATWVDFRYEFMLEYCFLYYFIGHPSRICVEKVSVMHDGTQGLQDHMLAFLGLEARKDMRGRKLHLHGQKSPNDSTNRTSGDKSNSDAHRRSYTHTRGLVEGMGGSRANCCD